MQFCTLNAKSFIMVITGPNETATLLGNIIGVVVAFLILCYLVYTLLRPEKF